MNAIILLTNRTTTQQHIFTEPWGESIDLPPNTEAIIEFTSASDNQQSIGLFIKDEVWVLYPANGTLIAVYVDGVERARYD